MKKLFVLALCVLGFILIAAPTAVERYQVFLNGKPFAKAALFNDPAGAAQLAIPLEEFARAGGANVTLDPSFQLQGTKLNAMVSSYSTDSKIKGEFKFHKAATVPSPEHKHKIGDIKIQAAQMFRVGRQGEISSRVFMDGGKAWVPLADVAKAFGAQNWTAPATLKPGEPIMLNFPVNPNGILIGL